jgi:competence protein ComEC
VNRQLEKTSIIVSDKEFGRRIQVGTTEKGLLPGDTITVRAQVDPPEDFVTQTGRLFGYTDYLASKGIVGLANNAIVVVVKQGGFSLARITTIIRFKIADIFADRIVFPFDGVLAGMIVGYQGGIPSSIQDLFKNTGVLHVLVLSGYNITMLAGFLAILLKGLPMKIRVGITITLIVLLVLVSGSGVASVRAGIMGSIALLGSLSLRTYQPMRALVLSYLLFFFISPGTIFADPGFHLSFLATMFMILILPKVELLFRFIPQTKHIDLRELLMLALSAPIFMLPYTMYFSGNFPLASPVANILMAVVTPVLSIVGILLIALCWLGPVAVFIGTVTSWAGVLILRILTWSSHMPVWNAPFLASGWTVLFYSALIVILFKKEISLYLAQLRSSLLPRTS